MSAMFETTGIINERIVAEMLPKDMPHLNRNTIILSIGFILLALQYPFGTIGFTLIMFCSVWPFVVNRMYRKKYMEVNMNAIRTFTDGGDSLRVTTIFHDDNVTMSLPNQENPVTLAYEDLHRVIETESIWCLSATSHSAVYVFKDQLTSNEKTSLMDFLKSKPTQIPENQLTVSESR